MYIVYLNLAIWVKLTSHLATSSLNLPKDNYPVKSSAFKSANTCSSIVDIKKTIVYYRYRKGIDYILSSGEIDYLHLPDSLLTYFFNICNVDRLTG